MLSEATYSPSSRTGTQACPYTKGWEKTLFPLTPTLSLQGKGVGG